MALAIALVAMPLLWATPASAVETLPILWEAGGLTAGNDGAGQAARIATDPSGNVAVVSGPSMAKDLAVTSYTESGVFRWQSVISPSIGTFQGDWVAAAPNGDFVAVGHNVNSSGNPIAITLVRFGFDGAFQWRVDLGGLFPSVGRLRVDSGGNAYLAFNILGDGQDIQLHKYSPAGALLWSQVINTGFASNNIATSLAFSLDHTEVALTGDTIGGVEWITALYDTATGVRKWLVVAPEGTAALDVVMDLTRVYVTGQGNAGITGFLTVVAYDRATGARLWRTDKKPADGGSATGLRMALAPDGSVVATGQTSRGFLDWYTVTFETTGAVRWEAVRDGGLNTDEIPAAVLVLPSGTTVVTGKGGPNLPGGFIPGVTVGYSPTGILLWEAFSPLATVWVTDLPNGDVVATGGYDAYLAAFRPPGTTSGTMHIADLDASAVSMGRTWTATVTATVRDNGAALVSGATVSGTWRRGNVGTCITTESGTCSVALSTRAKNEQFTVTGVTHASLTYDPSANTDPDGDSNGTVITIRRP
ncbi:MAG: hypothetical protein H0V54_15445 [Chthoniobacterales bacterium]|nr:hypothetical protein [Chthoniobacterales bacterium]